MLTEAQKQTLKEIIKFLGSAGLIVGGGVITGQAPLVVAAATAMGIGTNWSSDQAQAVSEKAAEIFSSSQKSGILNHDMQRALTRAFGNALSFLEKAYLETERLVLSSTSLTALQRTNLPAELFERLKSLEQCRFLSETDFIRALQNIIGQSNTERYQSTILQQIERVPPEKVLQERHRHAIRDFFQELRNNPERYFLDISEREIDTLLHEATDRNKAIRLLWNKINIQHVFNVHEVDDPDFRHFFEQHLVGQVQAWFYEELKTDTPECTKAWRAYQRFMLETVQINQHLIQEEQQEHFERLKARIMDLQDVVDRRLPDEPFQEVFSVIEQKLKSGLDFIADMQQKILTTVQETRDDVRQIDAKLERLLAHGPYGSLGREDIESIFVKIEKRFKPILNRHIELFAGRERELEHIEDFLTTHTKGYIFITAPSGYGKTALLANLVNPQKERFCYHFLSQLDKTEEEPLFLRNLCAQLCRYYGIGGELPREPEKLRALYSSLLDMEVTQPNKPLIVVIDGLDEAAYISDLHIPRKLPEGTFIIFSARKTGREYLQELGTPPDQVRTIELTGLDAQGISRLLYQAGDRAADLADDEQFITHLCEISGGDPFYLHFLVQDIKYGKVTSENLPQMPTGLDEYLDRQFEQLRHSLTKEVAATQKDLLSFLLVAKDKLHQHDLITLANIDEWDFDEVVTPLTRFLIQQDSAYTLCHPRFADYFRSKLSRSISRYETQLLTYCAEWNSHRSPYALRYYPEHLLEAGQHDDLFALARDGVFRQTQLDTFPENPNLPLETLQAALQAAIEDDHAFNMAEFLVVHGQQVIELRTAENPLDALRRTGSLARAYELADLYEPEQRLKWYLLLIWELNDSQRKDDAKETLNRLQQKPLSRVWSPIRETPLQAFKRQHEKILEPSPDEAIRTLLLMQIYDVSEEDFWTICQQTFSDPSCYEPICDELVKRGYLKAAIRAARQLPDIEKQGEKLRHIAQEQVKTGTVDDAQVTCITARKTIEHIDNVEQRIQALQELAMTQFEIDDQDEAHDTLEMALDVVQQFTKTGIRTNILDKIAFTQMKIEDMYGARKTLALLKGEVMQVELFDVEACGYWEGEKFVVEQRSSSFMPDETRSYQVKILSMIVIAQGKAGNLKEAKETLSDAETISQHISDAKGYAIALGQIAVAQIAIDVIDAVEDTIKQVKTAAQNIKDVWLEVKTLAAIVVMLAEAGDKIFAREVYSSVLTAIRETEGSIRLSETTPSTKSSIWRTWLSRGLPISRLKDRVSDKIQHSEEASQKAEALLELATAQMLLEEIFDAKVTLKKASIAAKESLSRGYSTTLWEKIVKKQIEIGDSSGALATARRLEKESWGTEVLKAIVDAQLNHNDIAGALVTTQSIKQGNQLIATLQKIALRPLDDENRHKAQKMVHVLLKKIEQRKIDIYRRDVLPKIAVIQTRLGDVPGALITAQKLWINSEIYALQEIATTQKQIGDSIGAQKTLRIILNLVLKADEYAIQRDSNLKWVATMQADIGDIREALASAQEMEHVDERLKTIQRIAISQFLRNNAQDARKILATAWSQQGKTSPSNMKDFVLKEISALDKKKPIDKQEQLYERAIFQAQNGNIKEALKISKKIDDKMDKVKVLCEIASRQLNFGDEKGSKKILHIAKKIVRREKYLQICLKWPTTWLQSALEAWTIRRMDVSYLNVLLLEWLIKMQEQSGNVRRALKIAQYIQDLYTWVPMSVTYAIAKMKEQDDDKNDAQQIIRMILTAIEEGCDKHNFIKLQKIAFIQAEIGDIEVAKATVRKSMYIDIRAETLGMIAAVQVKKGNKEAAKATMQEVQSEKYRDLALLKFAVALAETQDIQEALMTAKEIKEPDKQAEAFTEIASMQAQQGDSDGANTSFTSAISLAHKINSAEQQAKTLNHIARLQARSGFADDALHTAKLLPVHHERYLPQIAQVFSENGDHEHFKALLLPCASFLDAAYRMCGHLAQLYPEQAVGIAEVVMGKSTGIECRKDS